MWVTPATMPAHEWTIPPPTPDRVCTCRAGYTCPACLVYAQRHGGHPETAPRIPAGRVRGARIRDAALSVLTAEPQPTRALVAALEAQGISISTHALYHHLLTLAGMHRAGHVQQANAYHWYRREDAP